MVCQRHVRIPTEEEKDASGCVVVRGILLSSSITNNHQMRAILIARRQNSTASEPNTNNTNSSKTMLPGKCMYPKIGNSGDRPWLNGSTLGFRQRGRRHQTRINHRQCIPQTMGYQYSSHLPVEARHQLDCCMITSLSSMLPKEMILNHYFPLPIHTTTSTKFSYMLEVNIDD